MHQQKYTIAMVNYLNAKPFLYGLQHSSADDMPYDIRLLNPAECAKSFMEGEADIALVPAGSLHQISGYKRITRFGIAADDEVRTVCLFSHDQPADWNEIVLDDHSMTSVLLTRLIVSRVFQINPVYTSSTVETINTGRGQAVLMIGDKVFARENDFPVRVDLAAEWKKWTGLPFVFAVWIARPSVPENYIQQLEKSLAEGVKQIDAVIAENSENPALLREYYHRYIRYQLDPPYLQGLEKYLNLSGQLHSEQTT